MNTKRTSPNHAVERTVRRSMSTRRVDGMHSVSSPRALSRRRSLFFLGAMRTLTLLSVLLLGSCATPPASVSGAFSDEDIRQIRYLVEHRIAFKKPIRTIARESGDRVVVQTGRCSTAGDYCATIHLTKRGGNWRVEERTIEEETIIVTSADAHRLH